MAIKCIECGNRNGQTGSKGTETSPDKDLCNYCFEYGGYENQHSDRNHEGIPELLEDVHFGVTNHKTVAEYETWLAITQSEAEFMESCWVCHPELNLAYTDVKAKGVQPIAKKQGTRRPQLNHKGHSHPATPAARRACKKAFWAQDKVEATKWNHACDGNGKPVAPKPAKLHVAPLGPKGGVGASVKTAGAKAKEASK